MNNAAKTYRNRLIGAFAAYAGTLFGVNSFLADAALPLWQMGLLALLPMLPIALFVRAVILFSRSWDELQHRKALEAALIAFVIVGFGTFAYGFLEGVGFPRLEVIWILPMLLSVQGVAQIFVALRYQ